MTVKSLGYVGIESNKLADWSDWAGGFLGMQLVDRHRAGLQFRMDSQRQRFFVEETGTIAEGGPLLGWEVEDAAALEDLAMRLETAGTKVRRPARGTADQRHVADLIAFQDPAGTRLEAFYGAEVAPSPFVPGRPISGFRTGPLGLGHAVIYVPRIDDVMSFYTDILGFRLSDYVTAPFKIFFFHINARHHSLALAESPRFGLNHLMIELMSLDDVGQGYDIARVEEGRIGMTLGRHANDHVMSFYAHSPSPFMVEYGWGGRSIEMDGWQAEEIRHGSSLWGHDLTWLKGEALEGVRRLRRNAAALALREPVHVAAGQYTVGDAESDQTNAAIAANE